MVKIRTRKETGKLQFDFQYQGIRCREQTALEDTRENRKKLEVVARKIEAAMTLGQFHYTDFFPQSRMVARFAKRAEFLRTSAGGRSIPTVSEFKDQWIEEMAPGWRNSYLGSIISIFDSHVIPVFGSQVISQITKADILQFRAKLAKVSPETGKERKAATVNKIQKVFRLMMREAADRFEFDNPFDGVKMLKEKKTDIHPFSMDEVNLFLKHIRPDFHNYFRVRFFSGMRSGEVTGLRWENVDFDRGHILIREAVVRGQVEYTKNDGSYRFIDMTSPLREALKNQYKATGQGNYVFGNRQGGFLDNRNVCNRIWYPMLDYLGLKRRRLYETRHTAATLWMAAGENPEWIARQLGHVNTEMLFKVYSRYIPNLTRRDGSAFEDLISKNTGGQK